MPLSEQESSHFEVLEFEEVGPECRAQQYKVMPVEIGKLRLSWVGINGAPQLLRQEQGISELLGKDESKV